MPEPAVKAKVFVINDSGHNFAPAQAFGELVFMTKDEVNRFNVTQMKRSFTPFVNSSSPQDFVLHSGPGVMSAIACSMFAAKHGRLNLLLWRAGKDGDEGYVLRRLVF